MIPMTNGQATATQGARTVYVGGRYMSEGDASIPLFDRGFMFADGVYEVTAVIAGRLVDLDLHLQRLQRSAAAIGLDPGLDDHGIREMHEKLIRLNGLQNGVIYLQATRMAEDRNFLPSRGAGSFVVAFPQAMDIIGNPRGREGSRITLLPEQRWLRRDIKSTGLLAQVMAKSAARDGGFDDAWFVEDGRVTEGASSSTFIVGADGGLRTRELDNRILPGTTRRVILDIARSMGLGVREEAFTPDELLGAREAFSTSASTFVLPVVSVDGNAIGDGRAGPLTSELRKRYIERTQS